MQSAVTNGWEEMTKCVTVMLSETFPVRQHQARSPRSRQKAYMHSSLTKSVVQIGWTSFATVYSLASTGGLGPPATGDEELPVHAV